MNSQNPTDPKASTSVSAADATSDRGEISERDWPAKARVTLDLIAGGTEAEALLAAERCLRWAYEQGKSVQRPDYAFPPLTAEQFLAHVESVGAFHHRKAARILRQFLPGQKRSAE